MKFEMKKQHEKLLVALLAGMIMVGAAALAVQPAVATGYPTDFQARIAADRA